MTDIVYVCLGVIAIAMVSLVGWDVARRWMDASHARLLAQDKDAELRRSITELEQRAAVQQQLLTATRSGMDEALMRLDVIRGGNWPTRDEFRALDDELRKQFHRMETMDLAVKGTASALAQAIQEMTALQSMRPAQRRIGS